ncbi:Tectonic-2 [Stylophora pistillata]|uniref:Tectonic-2 n=1 Tax=Stylophora pistillata TaxID=50429 RepID=A0A2B4SSD2_STYPI|nr:Tectonic-2 [Stylophora pistillata]
MTKLWFLFTFVLFPKYLLQSVFGGKVNINLTNFQEGIIVVPENVQEGSLQVQLTGDFVSIPVTVICSTLETGPGLTSVEFINSSAPVGCTQVKFRIISPGRPVTIQCSGQSEEESTGNNALLHVTKAPTVHVCPDVVLLKRYLPKSSFQVQFSEEIKGSSVVVQCTPIEADGDSSVLQIKFTETSVDVGASKAQVSYELVSVGNPVQVICRADSSNRTASPVSSAVNKATSRVSGTSVTSPSPTSVPLTTSTVTVGRDRKKRSVDVLSPDRVVHQYFFNNSAGPTVTFAMDVSPLRILPPVGFIRVPSGRFSAVLALDKPAEDLVDVTCSVDVVPRGTDLQNTSEVCSGPTKDKVTFTNSSVEIQLNKKDIQFQKGELFQTLELTLSESPARRTEGLVRITCCGQATVLSLLYANRSAEAFLWVELRKLQPIDWNIITSGVRKSTLVSDIDLTCPCNLKKAACDTGCCCDQDCSDVENESSTCIPGFFGGATIEKPFQFSCQASWPDSTDWQPLLCVTINNNPLISYFYNLTSPPLAQDSSGFNLLSAKRKREAFTFSESEERQTSISSGFYSAGTTIKTATNTEAKNYARAKLGVLSLPQSVFNGLCVQNAAVRFLEDVSSGCVFESEESLCNSQSPWSALNYLMPNKLSQPACPMPPAVLAEGSLGDTVGEIPVISSTEVQYFCTDVADHVSTTAQKLGDARCNFDVGDTLPPAPFFNKTKRTCSNVVTKVEYEFTWSGRRIDAVQARITLGSVAIPLARDMAQLVTSDTFTNSVGQSFSVRFLHALRNSSNSSSAPVQRSGNPGYVLGRPVLGRLLNSTGEVTDGKIQLWSPGSDGVCAGSALTPVLYGEDAFSGCSVMLSFDDISNCSLLRETILTHQARLVQATHVGRTGNVDLDVHDDWLPIIRYQYTTWRLSCVSGYGLSCSAPITNTSVTQVVPSPSAITPSAASASVGVNISNSSVTPANQNSSITENGTDTREYAPLLQYFMLTSSVVFIRVPSVKPQPVKRTVDLSGICYREVCKEELFFPLTEAYQGEPRDKAIALSLFLIFLALVTFAVTKPWG